MSEALEPESPELPDDGDTPAALAYQAAVRQADARRLPLLQARANRKLEVELIMQLRYCSRTKRDRTPCQNQLRELFEIACRLHKTTDDPAISTEFRTRWSSLPESDHDARISLLRLFETTRAAHI